jgi:hypothetical protein
MKTLKCEKCNLKITQDGDNYRYEKPGFVVPTKLGDFVMLKRTYETEICPLCGRAMRTD